MLRLLRSIFVWPLALAALAAGAGASTFLAEGYTVRVWQAEDGLPQNLVTSAVQTQDGYLWFGTWIGLARFDGERFQVFDSAITPGLRDRRITSLFEDAQGTLWIGSESGVITRYGDGQFTPALPSSGAVGEKIIGIGSDEQGRLWAMRHNGAVDSISEPRDRIPSPIAPALPGQMAWTRNDRGEIWMDENTQATRLTNGKLAPVDFTPSASYSRNIVSIAASANGAVWLLHDNRIRKWENGAWTEDRGAFPWPDGPVVCTRELRDGTLAVGTIYSGLYLVFRDGRRPIHIDRSNGLPQNWIRFLYEDREGNLWAGTGTAGLVSIHAAAFSVLNSPDQWQGCTVLSVAPDRNGGLWIGTDGAAIYHFSAGKWTHYGEPEGVHNGYIPALTESSSGEVWMGHFWWGSPYRLANGRFGRPAGLTENLSPVFALLTTPGTDELLIGNRDGLLRWQADRLTWLIKAPEGSAGAALALARDRRGGIWCGFEEGGLAHLADGKLTTFHRQDGLASDSVRCLFADGDTLWIGTADRGLSRFKDGRFANIGVEQGLVNNFVGAILADDAGYLWLGTHHGLQRIRKDELERCADGAIATVAGQIYDQHDGLPTIEIIGGLQSAACKTADGRLWFASNKGLVAVDPSRIATNPTPPPVVLESLLVDGRAVPFDSGTVSSHLPPTHQRLEFRFSGLSFVAPNKVLFKYRLEGLDQTWIDAGTKRAAFYSHLPAGTYRFRVIACNNDGVWNTEGASLTFIVAPFFWETWWFVGACTLGVLVAVTVFVRHTTRRRMQRRVEELERQNAIERERSRIAQDIHDDIGANLSRITMLSQPTRGQLTEPEHAATVLSRIYSTAREVTSALDEIVWAVDPRHDTLDSLADYMGEFAQEILSAANIRCRLDLPEQTPAWPLTADTRHNLFLAFKEALNNAIKHSGATEVRVALQVQGEAFVLTVQDNGRSWTPPAPNSTAPARSGFGNGLSNMQTRLARIGGRCEIHSDPATGTRVSFIVATPFSSRRPSAPPAPL